MSPTNLLSLSPRNDNSNLLPVTVKSRETYRSGLVSNLLLRTAKSPETNCTRQVQRLQLHGQVAVMQLDSKRIKTGPFALETLSLAPVPNSTNTVINLVDGVHASLQRAKKRVNGGYGSRHRRKEFRARKLVSKGAALLNGSAKTAASLNGSNHVQQDERSEESS